MANTDNGPEPFDPALLAAFARVIILWSYAEQLQGHLLSFLLNAEEGRVFVISQNVSASTVTGWIRVLLQIPAVQATGIGDLSELLTEIDEVRAERNALAHGLWYGAPSPKTAQVHTVRWDRTEVIKATVVTIGDLDDLLRRIEDIVRKLRVLAGRSQRRRISCAAPPPRAASRRRPVGSSVVRKECRRPPTLAFPTRSRRTMDM